MVAIHNICRVLWQEFIWLSLPYAGLIEVPQLWQMIVLATS